MSKNLLTENEKIVFRLEERIVLSDKFLYHLGSRYSSNQPNGGLEANCTGIYHLNFISGCSIVSKPIGILLTLSIISLVLIPIFNLLGGKFLNLQEDTVSNVSLFLVLFAIIFLVIYLFVKNVVLEIYYTTGVLSIPIPQKLKKVVLEFQKQLLLQIEFINGQK